MFFLLEMGNKLGFSEIKIKVLSISEDKFISSFSVQFFSKYAKVSFN